MHAGVMRADYIFTTGPASSSPLLTIITAPPAPSPRPAPRPPLPPAEALPPPLRSLWDRRTAAEGHPPPRRLPAAAAPRVEAGRFALETPAELELGPLQRRVGELQVFLKVFLHVRHPQGLQRGPLPAQHSPQRLIFRRLQRRRLHQAKQRNQPHGLVLQRFLTGCERAPLMRCGAVLPELFARRRLAQMPPGFLQESHSTGWVKLKKIKRNEGKRPKHTVLIFSFGVLIRGLGLYGLF